MIRIFVYSKAKGSTKSAKASATLCFVVFESMPKPRTCYLNNVGLRFTSSGGIFFRSSILVTFGPRKALAA